jgi:ACR3 family arsenite efflux pump ArsB
MDITVSGLGNKGRPTLALIIGPLIEGPVMIVLVNVAFWLKNRLSHQTDANIQAV